MSFLTHCALLVLFSFFCIKLAPAQEFSPPCATQFLHPNSSFAVNNDNATLTLFDSSLILPSSLLLFSTNNQEYPDLTADLAFILRPPQPNHPGAWPSIQSVELDLMIPDVGADCIPDMGPSCFSDKLLNVCNPLPQHSLKIPVHFNKCSCKQPDPNYSRETELNVSLTYDEADAASLQVQVNYTGRYEINLKFKLDLPPEYDSREGDDNITLLIGYIIPTTTVPIQYVNNSKSNHITVVLWVIVGVSTMIFLMGLIILVLSIAKRRGRPSLVSSRPGGRVAPSSTTSRDPFPHHRLESGATPMMLSLPPSPPYNDDFHLTGTASWVKQPNPR